MNAAAVLAAARAELGTTENPHGSNRTPYGAAYGWDGVAWCAIWVWWVFGRAGADRLVPKTASTVVMRDWFRTRNRWYLTGPRPGDLVFFKFPGNNNPVNHVGIVEAIEPAGTLICLEGNTAGTASGDQRNGGMVARKRRMSNVVGFARPAYAATVQEDDMFTDQDRELLNQLARRVDVGHSRDQILTRMGVVNPAGAPAKLTLEQLAGIDPARRVDVGFARDQFLEAWAATRAEQVAQRALIEAIAEKVGVTPPGRTE